MVRKAIQSSNFAQMRHLTLFLWSHRQLTKQLQAAFTPAASFHAWAVLTD